jgi:transposase-like protein
MVKNVAIIPVLTDLTSISNGARRRKGEGYCTSIFIACTDGLTGFPAAIEAVFPQTIVQLCIVHMVRNSLNYVPYKYRKEVAADLKKVYGAATEKQGEQTLLAGTR